MEGRVPTKQRPAASGRGAARQPGHNGLDFDAASRRAARVWRSSVRPLHACWSSSSRRSPGRQRVTTLAPAGPPRSPVAVVRTFVALTKPRIIELLLVTTVPPMILAAKGLPSVWLIAATL